MNPWGFILVVVGILLIMIGITGSQHRILSVFKGIPAAASGSAPTSSSGGGGGTTRPVSTTTNPPVATA
jgi:hypothetical protein